MSVVLDTNVLISAVLSAKGAPATLVRAARDGNLDVVASPHLLAELQHVLQRDQFRRFLSLAEVDELIEDLGRILRIEVDPEPDVPVLRDPKDDYLLFLARAVGADYIVSGDADLTDEVLQPPAITPRQAVERFGLG